MYNRGSNSNGHHYHIEKNDLNVVFVLLYSKESSEPIRIRNPSMIFYKHLLKTKIFKI